MVSGVIFFSRFLQSLFDGLEQWNVWNVTYGQMDKILVVLCKITSVMWPRPYSSIGGMLQTPRLFHSLCAQH